MSSQKEEIIRRTDFSRLPKSLIVYLGKDLDYEVSQYCFWKDGKSFTVTKGNDIPKGYDPLSDDLNWRYEVLLDVEESEAKVKELVMTRGLNFDHPDRGGWLAETKRGLIIWTRPLNKAETNPKWPEVVIPIWNAKVREQEVQVTRIITPQDRVGIWTGKNGVKQDVNLVIGWNKFWLQMVKSETEAHRLIIGRGLNMTYQMLAHVVDANGYVIGLMTEAHLGRLVEFEDMEIVFAAFRRLNEEGLFVSPQQCSIMIYNGQVRLRSISSLRRIPSAVDAATKAKDLQWSALSSIFMALRQRKNCLVSFAQFQQTVTILPSLPSPTLLVRIPLGQLKSFFNTISPENWNLYTRRRQCTERKREEEAGRAPGYPLIYPSDTLAMKSTSTGSGGLSSNRSTLAYCRAYRPY